MSVTRFFRMQRRLPRAHLSTGGFTLIELLVSVAVFSLGMLSLAALELSAFRMDQASTWRWEASILASDMADRIRANPIAANAGIYSTNLSVEPPTCIGTQAPCTPTNMANHDKSVWQQAISELPGGSGTVTSNGSGEFTVTVRWDDARNGATGTNCPPLTDADLRCFEVDVAL